MIYLLHIRLFCEYVVNGSVFLGHVLGKCFLICVGLINQANCILLTVSLHSGRLGCELVPVFQVHLKIRISQGIRGSAGAPMYVVIRVIVLNLNRLGYKISLQKCWIGSQEPLMPHSSDRH